MIIRLMVYGKYDGGRDRFIEQVGERQAAAGSEGGQSGCRCLIKDSRGAGGGAAFWAPQ